MDFSLGGDIDVDDVATSSLTASGLTGTFNNTDNVLNGGGDIAITGRKKGSDSFLTPL